MDTDLRIIKTKTSIFDALIELMSNKTFEDIRVSEICEVAGVNRSTFYMHYDDKYDLLDNLVKSMKNDFVSELNIDNTYVSIQEYYNKTLDIIGEHLSQNRKKYSRLLINNRSSIAMDMIYDVLKDAFTVRIKEYYKGNMPIEILSTFYIGGIFNVVMLYLTDSSYDIEEIKRYLKEIIRY